MLAAYLDRESAAVWCPALTAQLEPASAFLRGVWQDDINMGDFQTVDLQAVARIAAQGSFHKGHPVTNAIVTLRQMVSNYFKFGDAPREDRWQGRLRLLSHLALLFSCR